MEFKLPNIVSGPSMERCAILANRDRRSIHDLSIAQTKCAAWQIKRCGSPPVEHVSHERKGGLDSGWNRRRAGLRVESLAVVTALPTTPIPILLNYRSSVRDWRSDLGIVPLVSLSCQRLDFIRHPPTLVALTIRLEKLSAQFLPIAEIIRRLDRSVISGNIGARGNSLSLLIRFAGASRLLV